jgi:hypothetical protein
LIVVAISVVVTNLITFLLVWVLPVIAFWLELVNITSAMRDGKAKIAEAQDANETNLAPQVPLISGGAKGRGTPGVFRHCRRIDTG